MKSTFSRGASSFLRMVRLRAHPADSYRAFRRRNPDQSGGVRTRSAGGMGSASISITLPVCAQGEPVSVRLTPQSLLLSNQGPDCGEEGR